MCILFCFNLFLLSNIFINTCWKFLCLMDWMSRSCFRQLIPIKMDITTTFIRKKNFFANFMGTYMHCWTHIEKWRQEKCAEGLTLDTRAEFWFLAVLFPPVPIVPLGSGFPGGLVAVEVLLEAPAGLLAFFILGSKFLIHLQRNLHREREKNRWAQLNVRIVNKIPAAGSQLQSLIQSWDQDIASLYLKRFSSFLQLPDC